MKAIRIERTGGPEVLEYVDLPTPQPGPKQVLVRAHAIGVNMPEVFVRRGVYRWMPPLPAIPGIEMSGHVEAVGADVRNFRAGQPVYVSARELEQRSGCYAQYIAVNEEALYAVPESADLEAIATLSGYQVAWHVLNSATRGFRYESVLVTAAGGGIGSACVQLARAAGKRVLAVAGSDEKVEFALSQGAEAAINYRSENVPERVKALTAGRGVDLVLDSVAGKDFPQWFGCLDILGMVVLYGNIGGPADPAAVMQAMQKVPGRSLAWRNFSMHAFDHDPASRRQCTNALLDLLGKRAIDPVIYERVPLAQAARAQEMLESGRVIGKVLLKP
jgi:NADPH2:quinone reductase